MGFYLTNVLEDKIYFMGVFTTKDFLEVIVKI